MFKQHSRAALVIWTNLHAGAEGALLPAWQDCAGVQWTGAAGGQGHCGGSQAAGNLAASIPWVFKARPSQR